MPCLCQRDLRARRAEVDPSAGGDLGRLRGHLLHAPALMPSEVTSTLRELVWRGEAPDVASNTALGTLATLPIEHAAAGSRAIEATAAAAQLG
jgi:hypothetical protein